MTGLLYCVSCTELYQRKLTVRVTTEACVAPQLEIKSCKENSRSSHAKHQV